MNFKDNDAEGKMGEIKNIIWMEQSISQENREALEGAGFTVHLYNKVIMAGRVCASKNYKEPPLEEYEPEDCFLICYGPGTTNGDEDGSTPLGVKVTNKMMIQTV